MSSASFITGLPALPSMSKVNLPAAPQTQVATRTGDRRARVGWEGMTGQLPVSPPSPHPLTTSTHPCMTPKGSHYYLHYVMEYHDPRLRLNPPNGE